MKAVVTIALLLLASLGLAILMLMSFGKPTFAYLPQKFDSRRWQAASADDARRCSMLLDLRYRLGIEGRTKSEVHQLLGAPALESATISTYVLCPSTTDYYLMEIGWKDDVVRSVRIRDS